MKGNFWHTGIIYEGKAYECFNYGRSAISDCGKERMDALHAMQAVIVDADIDERKLLSEINSGTSCSEFVARVIGLSRDEGEAKEYWPQDVHDYLMRRVSFALDKDLDKEMALEFLGSSAGGADFTQGIIGPHPDLAAALGKGKGEQGRIIDAYFDAFSNAHEAELMEARNTMEQEWRQDEEKFFAEAAKIFGDAASQGRYACYVSAIDCNPRFLDKRAFQVFYKHHAGASYAVAHELLHFLFFDYVRAVSPGLIAAYGTESGPLWDISELFDNALMMSQGFMEGEYASSVHCYPEHAAYLADARSAWEGRRDVDIFIAEMLRRLTA